jgi:predicted DNA-binding transcriptional regulator
VITIFYAVTLFFLEWLGLLGLTASEKIDVRFWIVTVPVFITFIAVMCVGAWIGWTMATTPPPKPIEEIASATEEKTEEKTEEESKTQQKAIG